MYKALVFGFGFFIGTAAYSFGIHSPHYVDWFRSGFIGLFVFFGMWLWFSLKGKKSDTSATISG